MTCPQPPFAMTPYMAIPTHSHLNGESFNTYPWASELLVEIKHIKEKLKTVDETVNTIKSYITAMELKVTLWNHLNILIPGLELKFMKFSTIYNGQLMRNVNCSLLSWVFSKY